jgi:uncharacterized membrane protein YjgN (DUF898 family)
MLLIVLCMLNGLVYLFRPELLWLPALLLALLWPALWQASLVFRFSHTQWRGVNLGFAGTVTQAYGVMLPLCLPALFGVPAKRTTRDSGLLHTAPTQQCCNGTSVT